MKFLTTTGLTELITKIKSSFISNSDVVTATTLDIDSTPTASSSNLVTSGAVFDFYKTISGYDATKTQILKHVNGTLTWVDET